MQLSIARKGRIAGLWCLAFCVVWQTSQQQLSSSNSSSATSISDDKQSLPHNGNTTYLQKKNTTYLQKKNATKDDGSVVIIAVQNHSSNPSTIARMKEQSPGSPPTLETTTSSHEQLNTNSSSQSTLPSLPSSSLMTTIANATALTGGYSEIMITQLQRRVQNDVQDHLLLLSQNGGQGHNDVTKRALLPPHTPGAFIHIGKTGGSTLTGLLQHACHSFLPKPCRRPNESDTFSVLSKATTYIHVPDFSKLGKVNSPYSNFSFYVISTRDPFERFLSAFTYEHPLNGGKAPNQVFECFPTLERFTEVLGDEPKDFNETNVTKVEAESFSFDSCRNLARTIMDGKSRFPEHVYWGFQTVFEKVSLQFRALTTTMTMTTSSESSENSTEASSDDNNGLVGHDDTDQTNHQARRPLVVSAIRNEHKKRDFVSVFHWLMMNHHKDSNETQHLQSPDHLKQQEPQWNVSTSNFTTNVTYDELVLGTKPFPEKAARQQTTFKVTKDISPFGRKRLCRAMEDEYRTYIQVLHHSINLSPQEKNDSMELSRQNCPDLEILRVVFLPYKNDSSSIRIRGKRR